MINTNFPFDLSLKMDSNPSLPGLDSFLKALERMFFAEVKAQMLPTQGGELRLVLTVECSLDLLEALYHHQNGNWGSRNSCETGQSADSVIQGMLWELQRRNRFRVDIEEFNLEFKDMLLVMRRIAPGSIASELESVLEAIAAHYIEFAGREQEVPYEIYVPVTEVPPRNSTRTAAPNNHAYYHYWAVYFESESDARIYDLERRELLTGDLYFRNP